MEHRVVTDYTSVKDKSNVKVFVRMRPPEGGGEVPGDMFEGDSKGEKRLTIRDPKNSQYGEHAYSFDRVFWPSATQEETFDEVASGLIDSCFEGYNGCCFAYGQTGSGKTYSMFGEAGRERGIIPRAVEHLFDEVEVRARSGEVAVAVSFLEMYCDQIRDLGKAYLEKGDVGGATVEKTSDWYMKGLARTRSFAKKTTYASQNLEIHEDSSGHVFVKDLSVIPVSTPEEVVTIMRMGFRLRATHETKMNSVSSRSHTVFTISIVQKSNTTGETITGTLNLVDLAGSERLNKSESSGQRLQEALSINSSLSALGKVVMSLDPAAPSQYIPYRDSKLTRLLQNSIGGNSITVLLATIHPRASDFEECMSTMQFANRCRSVSNKPRVNYLTQSPEEKDRQIQRLNQELSQLRRTLGRQNGMFVQRIAQMMQQLGIKGEVKENGCFVTESGATIGLPMDGASAGHGFSADFKDSIGDHGAGLISGSGSGAGVLKELNKQKELVHALRGRIERMKKEKEKLKDRMQLESTAVRVHATSQLRKAAEISSIAQVAEQATRSKLTAVERAHEAEIATLVKNNQRLLRDASDAVLSIPSALREAVKSQKKLETTERSVKVRESKKLNTTVASLRQGFQVEMEATKANHEATVAKLSTANKRMKGLLQAYREKMESRTKEMGEELLSLHAYASALQGLVDDMRSGRIPVIHATSGAHAFYVPLHLIPADPLRPKHAMPQTKRLLPDTFDSRPRSALAVVRSRREQESVEFTGTTQSLAGLSCGSALATADTAVLRTTVSDRTPAPHQSARKPPQERSPPSLPVQQATAPSESALRSLPSASEDPFDAFDPDHPDMLRVPIDIMDEGQLRATIRRMTEYMKSGLRAEIEEQVLNDLSEHSTVSYIQRVEAAKKHYQSQCSELTKKLNDMKISHLSQARQLEKLQAKHLTSKHGRKGTFMSRGLARK